MQASRSFLSLDAADAAPLLQALNFLSGESGMAERPKIDLSIYLAKGDNKNPDRNIKNVKSMNRLDLDLGRDCRATLYVRRKHSNPPKWATFFQEFVNASVLGRNSSTGAGTIHSLEEEDISNFFWPRLAQH